MYLYNIAKRELELEVTIEGKAGSPQSIEWQKTEVLKDRLSRLNTTKKEIADTLKRSDVDRSE